MHHSTFQVKLNFFHPSVSLAVSLCLKNKMNHLFKTREPHPQPQRKSYLVVRAGACLALQSSGYKSLFHHTLWICYLYSQCPTFSIHKMRTILLLTSVMRMNLWNCFEVFWWKQIMWNQVVSQIHNPLSQMGIKYYLPLEDYEGWVSGLLLRYLSCKRKQVLKLLCCILFCFCFFPTNKKRKCCKIQGPQFL